MFSGGIERSQWHKMCYSQYSQHSETVQIVCGRNQLIDSYMMRILSEKSDSRRSCAFMVNSEHISKHSLVLSIVKIEKVNVVAFYVLVSFVQFKKVKNTHG